METVLTFEPVQNFRGLLRCACGHERDGASGADVRFHRRARPCLRGRRKRGQEDQALGRSRGGFSTKIILKVDLDGLPLAFHLTGGEASDCRNFEVLLDIGPDVRPRAAITDTRYDSRVLAQVNELQRNLRPAVRGRGPAQRQRRIEGQDRRPAAVLPRRHRDARRRRSSAPPPSPHMRSPHRGRPSRPSSGTGGGAGEDRGLRDRGARGGRARGTGVSPTSTFSASARRRATSR